MTGGRRLTPILFNCDADQQLSESYCQIWLSIVPLIIGTWNLFSFGRLCIVPSTFIVTSCVVLPRENAMYRKELFAALIMVIVSLAFLAVVQAQENGTTGASGSAPEISANTAAHANSGSFGTTGTSDKGERSGVNKMGREENGESKLPMTGTTEMRDMEAMSSNGGWAGQGLVFRRVKVEKEKNLSVDDIVAQLRQAALPNGLTVVGYVNEDAAERAAMANGEMRYAAAGWPNAEMRKAEMRKAGIQNSEIQNSDIQNSDMQNSEMQNSEMRNTIKAKSLLVENPRDASKLLCEDPAAALVVPTRVTVFERDGHFVVAYIRPSEALKKFSHEDFHEIGAAMDTELSGLVRSVTE